MQLLWVEISLEKNCSDAAEKSYNDLHLYEQSSFKFGDSKLVKTLKKVKISIIIHGVQATVTADVMEYDIP